MRTSVSIGFGLILAITAAQLPAQIVRGAVRDAASNAPITAVSVALLDEQGRESGRVLTDSAGWFDLRAPRPGAYKLQLTLLPYVPFTSDRIELSINQTTQVALRMGTGAIPLSPVVVVARGMNSRIADFEMRRARHGTGVFITQQEIERRPLAKSTSVLIGVAGVVLQPIGRRGTADDRNIVQLVGSSSRPCMANVFIDGVPTSQTPATIDDRIDVATLAAVEVYPRAGTAPAEFQRGNTCGTVLFWTREVQKRSGSFGWGKLAIAVGVLTLGFLVTR